MALVAWYKLNGNVLDSTINGHNGTINGSPTVVNDGPLGTCYSFNPDTADWIVINNLSQFIYNTPFTISAWVKTAGLGTNQTVNGIVTLTYGLRLNIGNDGKPYVALYNGTSTIQLFGTTNCYDNKWHHIAGSYDGSSMKIYVDGILENSNSNITSNISWTNGGAIGLDVNISAKLRFNGYISDVKIYDEALSLKEIKELSKAKILHYDFNMEPLDGITICDKSGYGHNGIIAEATAPTYVNESPVGKGCYQFDGNSDNIQVPILKSNNEHKYTISFWCYCNETDTRDIFFGNYSLLYNFNIEKWTDNTLRFWYSTTSIDKRCTLFVIPIQEWCHITVVMTSSNVSLYKNGNFIYEYTGLTMTADIFSNIYYIGRDTRTGTTAFNGKIADFRFYANALSDDYIKEIYQTHSAIDKNGNLFTNCIDNGDIVWDSEINSINLIKNGSAELEDNTNFTSLTYIDTDSYDGNGCFYRVGSFHSLPNEFVKINKEDSYFLSGYFKSVGSSGLLSKLYFEIDCFDYLKQEILPMHICHYTNTETYLTQAINNGDTVIHVNSTINWHNSSYAITYRRIGIYYKNLDLYPKYTYTRESVYYTDIDTENNTITLSDAWTGGTIPSGSAVANHYDSNTRLYIAATYASVPTEWTKYINSIAITGWAINNTILHFRYGTKYIKIGMGLNYGQDSTYATEIDNLKFWNSTKAQAKPNTIQFAKTGISTENISEVGITEGLVAYYPLNGDAKDYSGNGNHGTVYGAAMATGINNKKCYSFDGTDDYILASNIEAINNNCISLGCWCYFNSMSAWTGIITKGIDTGSYGIQLDRLNTHKLQFTANYASNQYVNGNTVLVSGNWYYLFAVYNNRNINLYINGILDLTTTVTWDIIENSENLSIGCDFPGSNEYINGNIQDVRIYNRALTDKEINILYNIYNPNINQTIQINKENILYTKGNIKEV